MGTYTPNLLDLENAGKLLPPVGVSAWEIKQGHSLLTPHRKDHESPHSWFIAVFSLWAAALKTH